MNLFSFFKEGFSIYDCWKADLQVFLGKTYKLRENLLLCCFVLKNI